ncbi:hypothetical protein RvY_18551-2 [Ramazzottius varieornatus]|nr:hypothetical protein RvY_18551-2 [Ramazzottius varieornatus]
MARTTQRVAKSAQPASESGESESATNVAEQPEEQHEEEDAGASVGNFTRGAPTGHLTEDIRLAIIAKHEAEPDLSQGQLTKWLEDEYNIRVNRTTIGRTLSRAEGRTVRPPRPEGGLKTAKELDQDVYNWYLERAKAMDTTTSLENDTAPLLAFGVNTFKEKARELAESGDYELRKNMYFSDKWLSTFLRKFNLQVTSLPVDADGEAVLTDANGTSQWHETNVEGVETDDEDGNANNQTDTQNNDSLIKHVQLTDEMRAALVEKRVAEPAWSQLQLANWLESEYGVKVHRATIGRNLKRLSTDPVVRDAKRQFSESSQIYPELEGRLIDWWIIETSRGRVLDDKDLKDKIREFYDDPDLDLPVAVNGARYRKSFKSRMMSKNARTTVTNDGIPPRPTLTEVHRAVNVVRTFLFNSDYGGDVKKSLMADLDSIYVKISEAQKKVTGSNKIAASSTSKPYKYKPKEDKPDKPPGPRTLAPKDSIVIPTGTNLSTITFTVAE